MATPFFADCVTSGDWKLQLARQMIEAFGATNQLDELISVVDA
jgi:hypothetical protein